MSVAPALTTAELAAFAGPSMPEWYMVYDTTSGNVVATALVDTGVLYPLGDLPVTGTSAGWANIQPNQTVLIGSTAGGCDRGIFRVRKAASTATTLALALMGWSDTGEINLATHNVSVTPGDYITVLNRFDPFGVFPFIDYSGTGTDATIYEDYDSSAYAAFNRYPPPIVNLVIDGQPANYAAHVYANTSKTFDIVLAVTLWPTSSSATFAITLPASWTLNSGSLTGSGLTNTINVTAPHSADTYTLQVAVTEDHGSVFTAVRKVWIKSHTYPPLSIVQIGNDVDDRIGSRCSVTLNQLVGLPPGAMIHLFDAGTWNGEDVPTARKCFTGYVERRQESTDVGLTSVTLDLIGPSYMLDLIGGQSQIMTAVDATPGSWQQLYYTLSYLDFVIWWILYQRASGFLQMFNYTSFGLTASQKRMTDWRIDTGTLLSQVRAQATRYGGGNFGCDPTGEFMLRRHVSRTPWADRGSVPVRDMLTASRYKRVVWNYVPRPQVRRVRGEAFYSDGLTTNTPVWCDAPQYPGQGAQEAKLDRQIVDDPGELYELTGNDYQARNNPYPTGTILVPKNYAAIFPAQMPRLGLDIAASLRYDGLEYTGYVLPTQVAYTHNPDGTIDTAISVEAETVGLQAIDVPIPSPDSGTNAQTKSQSNPYQRTPFVWTPYYRNPNPNPKGTNVGAAPVPGDGSAAFCGTATNAYVVSKFLGTPVYRDVAPVGLGSFAIKHGMLEVGGTRAWLLVSDGTDSKVYSTVNVFALPAPTWSAGASVFGVYTVLRATTVPGTILIYAPITGASTSTATVTFDPGGYSYAIIYGTVQASGNPGNCLRGKNITASNCTGGCPGAGYTCAHTSITFPVDVTVTGLQGDVKFFPASGCGAYTHLTFLLYDSGGNLLATKTGSTVNANGVWGTSIVSSFSQAGVRSITIVASDCNCIGRSIAIDNLQATYNIPGNAIASVSLNNGATFMAAAVIGTSVSAVGGFDQQRAGTVSYGAALNVVRKASALGGSFVDDQSFSTSPALIEIPWGKRNSTSLDNSGTNPEYLVGLDAADGSGNTLYWIVGGSPVDITPTIGGYPGIPAGADCLTTYLGQYIAYLASFNGTKHLVTSSNAGTSWTDRGAVDATFARVRRLASAVGQLYLAGAVLDYSANFGAALTSKTKPSAGTLLFWEAAH